MIPRATAIQFIRFCLIGLLNTGIHYGVFLLLLRLAGIHYLVATVVGYCCGVINSYCMNRTWTFQGAASQRHREFAKFFWVNTVSLGVNVVALKVSVAYLYIPEEFALILAIGVSTVTNFLGNKFWTFKGGTP